MKLNNKIIKKLIRESLAKFLNEEYKGTIGGKLEKDKEGKYVSARDKKTGEGIPHVFDSDEQNTLSSNFSNPELLQQTENNPELKRAVGPIPKASPEKQKKIAGRMFSGKSFKKNASWMWGNNAFPGSNVYLIPIAGGAQEAAKLIFGSNPGFTRSDLVYSKMKDKSFYDEIGEHRRQMSDSDINIYKNTIVDFQTRRNLLFDIEAEGINILTNLGVNIGEISSMNLESDIIFIPLVTGTARNFMSSPHMIIHAMCDTTGEKGGTELDNIINPLQAELAQIINDLGFSSNTLRPLSDDQNLKKMHKSLKTMGTTYAFRNNLVFTSNDMVSEMLTQEITNQSPKGFQRGRGGHRPALTHESGASLDRSKLSVLPKDVQKKLFSFVGKIKSAAQEIRKLLKGKIILINVV